jgi:ATP/maltotriose-dependent transcriptional regulator MalT
MESGDFLAAISVANEAATNALLTGNTSGHAYALGQRALVHAHLGNEDETRADAAEAATLCASLGFWQPMLWVASALGLLELSLGNPEAAWAAVRQLTEQTEADPNPEPHVHRHLPVALEALINLAELDRAEHLLDWFEKRGREVDRGWALAHAARARGLLLIARGDVEGAERSLASARAGFEQLGIPFEAARTLLTEGELRRRRRQNRAARESLEQAERTLQQLGARLWAELARAELARVGGRKPPTTRALTPAEEQVALLAANGLSNKEIARRLVVTVNTIESHLKHVYTKLGVHSRRQLAIRLDDRTAP